MDNILAVLLLVLGGMLVGGAFSLHRQGAARGTVVVVAVLAVLATAGGILWLLPGEG
ncbi:hypothetical protein [Melissospora conviva]|uniref:hypothetical protein n=1 Tax=Melissospora conviva TaxID=3388432 RepID=UPI003B76B5E6